MNFVLDPRLVKKIFIIDLPLCKILLEDNKHYPWLFLVPRRESKTKIMDLNKKDQLQLLHELDLSQKILWDEFKPKQLNVAAIGNKTAQLHIHVIARYENDPSWPNTVWNELDPSPYDSEHKHKIITQLQTKFSLFLK